MKSSFKRPAAGPAKTAAAPAPAKKPIAPPAKAPARPLPTRPAPPTAERAPLKKVVAPAPVGQRPKPAGPRPGIKTNVPVETELPLEEEIEVEAEVIQDEELEPTGREVAVIEDEEEETHDRELANTRVNMFDSPVGKGVGQFDASDLEMPLLKIAQGSDSPLINDLGFTDGDLVLAKESILWQPDCEPVELTVLRYQKMFQQQLDYDPGSDVFPKTYETKEEAAAGGLIPFGGHEVGFVPIMDITILIKQPEGVEGSAFTEEFEGVLFAQAMWQIRGTAYKAVARKIYTQERTRLRAGTHHGAFTLELQSVKWKKGRGWAPLLRNGAMHSPEFIEFCEQVATGQTEV